MNKISLSVYRNIVILTGAGVSVASGISPFRGAGGLWNDPQVARLSAAGALQSDPAAVWQFWAGRRQTVLACQPNAAHLALASLEGSLQPDQHFMLVTQNVDGLHQRAGSRNVVELHGSIFRTRCANPECGLEPYADSNIPDEPPACPRCGGLLRADIVLFGEELPARAMWDTKRALRDCDLFLAIGTSGLVFPAADFVRGAEYAGARTVYINPEAMDPPNRYFKESILGKAEEILPTLFN